MVENKKRVTINVDAKDFHLYQELSKLKYFDNNLHVFTCAVLIGKFILGKWGKIEKSKDYIRINDNKFSDNLTILKCLAISNEKDINILSNEDELYSYCEKYACTGIKELYNWYKSSEIPFDVKIAECLLDVWNKLDLSILNESKQTI